MKYLIAILLLMPAMGYAEGMLGDTESQREFGPHSVSPAASETTEGKEWGTENQRDDGSAQQPYTGGLNGLSWDEIWWYLNNRYDANSEQVSMNHGFIVIKPDYVTGVVGAGKLVQRQASLPAATW
ncbi:MAG: hypothetical protein K8I27_00335 [Planctomycetes bacterium]|nr:hypothetical protein [Planctomycetota bacterium]